MGHRRAKTEKQGAGSSSLLGERVAKVKCSEERRGWSGWRRQFWDPGYTAAATCELGCGIGGVDHAVSRVQTLQSVILGHPGLFVFLSEDASSTCIELCFLGGCAI